jgi:enamine deaminase RidA (YjgF/YER057c/UK114 family)
MICALDNLVAPNDVPSRWANDPMMIFSSSVVSNNMGTANCFYNGVLNSNAAVGQHRFSCVNIGAIATGTKLGLAFQFSLNNAAKSIDISDVALNSVQTAVTTLTCTLKVNTWTTDSSSTVEWVSQAYTTKVDGSGQTSKFGEYSSFIGT